MVLLKDPAKVNAGRIGALRRWGPVPRVIRLDSLTAEQAAVVVALVQAAELNTKRTPAPAKADAQEVDRATDHTPTS